MGEVYPFEPDAKSVRFLFWKEGFHIFKLIDKLKKEQTLSKEEWISLIEGRTPELAEYLSNRQEQSGTNITGMTYISVAWLSLQITVKMTASTVVSVKAIAMRTATVSQKSKFSAAATQVII